LRRAARNRRRIATNPRYAALQQFGVTCMIPIDRTIGWLAANPEAVILIALVLIAVAVLTARRSEA